MKTSKNTRLEIIYRDFLAISGWLSLISCSLLGARIISTMSLSYGFLVWNVFLAWLPALLAWKIIRYHDKNSLRPTVILWIIAWVLFLPNTFYIVSDFIHLHTVGGASKLFDAALLFAFSLTGFLLGIASLAVVHSWLNTYIKKRNSGILIGGVILLSSFAIYLGRYQRWNSWDIIFNPLGILFDISDRIIHPTSHPETFTTTLLFFILIGGVYACVYYMVHRIARRMSL